VALVRAPSRRSFTNVRSGREIDGNVDELRHGSSLRAWLGSLDVRHASLQWALSTALA